MAIFTVSAIQLTSTQDWQANLRKVLTLMSQAMGDQPDLIVLPENVFLFDAKRMRLLAEGDETQTIFEALKAFALEHSVFILVGSHPMAHRPDGSLVDGGRVRQSSLLLSNLGEWVARYDKVHLFDVQVNDKASTYQESRYIEPGDISSVVFDIKGLKVGLSICYDLRFPEFYRSLLDQSADLVVVPSAFTHRTGAAHWHTLLQARAIENQFYVVGVDQAGWHNETRCTYGNTVAYSPWGDKLGGLNDTESSVLSVQINTDEVQKVRQAMPCLAHRRIR